MKKLFATIVLAVCAAFTASAAVNLGNLTKNTVVKDGAVIKGTLGNANVRVSIADGATVTIRDIEIQKTDKACAGLTCKGDATIILEGENKISACGDGFPGIFVPAGHTLTIKGFGKLDVNGEGYAAGIGGGENLDCGNIIIDGGTITASGGMPYGGSQEVVNGNLVIHVGMPGAGPGIGSGRNAKCGNIFFKRGNVTATGTERNPGIGADRTGGYNALVKFYNSIGKVTAITVNGDNTFTYDHALFDSLPDSERWITGRTLTQKDSKHDYVGGYNRVSTITSVLGGLTGNKTFKGEVFLYGEVAGDYKISIAKGATVHLQDVTIGPSLKTHMPGITCNGDATIRLIGTNNYVRGCGSRYPGIFVPNGCTLTIEGPQGALDVVSGGEDSPAIGACHPSLQPMIIGVDGLTNYQKPGGNVKIFSGTIKATGGENSVPIGGLFKRRDANTGTVSYENWGGTVYAETCTLSAKAGMPFMSRPGLITLGENLSRWETPEEGFDETYSWNGNLSAHVSPNSPSTMFARDQMTIYCDDSGKRGSVTTVRVPDGARITIRNLKNPDGDGSVEYFQIECLGDAEITLEGESKIYNSSKPAISCRKGHTLTIKGKGKLTAITSDPFPVIGGDYLYNDCGTIVFEGGVIIAEGGYNAQTHEYVNFGGYGILIGARGSEGTCDKIIFKGGYVRAYCVGHKYDYFKFFGSKKGASDEVELSKGMQSRRTTKEVFIGNSTDGMSLYQSQFTAEVSWNGKLPEVDEDEEASAGEASPKQQMKLASALPKAAPRLLGETLELDTVESRYVAGNGTIIKGTLNGRHKICIAPDATVILRDASIWTGTMSDSSPFAGITCLGNATIRLEGANSVSSFHRYFPAISVPADCTLVIDGPGSLNAQGGNEGAAGIGGVYDSVCGSVIISNGVVRATAVGGGAGIGGGAGSGGKAGSISIFGGSVEATGGTYGAGIGSGEGGTCYKVTINGGEVVATGGTDAAGIGTGKNGAMNTISIGIGISKVTAVSGGGAYQIGRGVGGELERINIAYQLADTTSGNTCTLKWSGALGNVHSFPADEIPELVAYDGTVISGTTLNTSSGVYRKCKISIAPGARVKLNNATINTIGNAGVSDSTPWAGLTCLGDATIELFNENEINTFNADYPGIYVPRGCTLTIVGSGKLVANSQNAAGIGGGTGLPCGTISIKGGDVLGFNASGLAAGIGGGDGSRCDGVEIFAGITKVEAYSSDSIASVQSQPVGAGKDGYCKSVYIGEGVVEEDASTFATGHPFRRTFTTSPNVNLSTLTGNTTVQSGAVVTGALYDPYEVTIAAGAEVTLSGVYIAGGSDSSSDFSGIRCLGNATIWLDGENHVAGFYRSPAISVAPGYTLTIKSKNGDDSLVADASAFDSYSAGIGAGWSVSCGNIVIDGGIIKAYGGSQAAGIGGATQHGCGTITINGGSVYAYGGSDGAGIGCGVYNSSCGTVTVNAGITCVEATRGGASAQPIGTAYQSSCGTVTIASGLREKPEAEVYKIYPNTDVDLSSLSSGDAAVVLRDEATVSGTLGVNRQVVIADGASVTLSGVTINGYSSLSYDWAGITCEGDAVIILDGENSVKGSNNHPGIFVPDGCTLTIKGDGSLVASSWGAGAGIGGGSDSTFHNLSCGDIVIEGGRIAATGGAGAAGIGGSSHGDCGYITITGGSITATGGAYANGIGAGQESSCAGVTIENGIDYLSATCNGDDVNECVPIGTLPDDASGVTVYGGLVEESSETVNGDTITRNRTFLPAELDLSKLPEDMTELTLQDGMTIKGTLGHVCKVSIAPGAHIKLWQATIQGENEGDYPWAGLTCLGDARITLQSYSRIKGFLDEHPGIYVPENYTLTIDGTGSLEARSNGYAAGIGAGYLIACGNIVINGGTVTATGGQWAAGIGGGDGNACGDITINGGTVTATGGQGAAGIGGGNEAPCGTITIGPGISLAGVTATRGPAKNGYVGEPIGRGANRYGGASCAGVAVDPSLSDETADATRTVVRQSEIDLSTLTKAVTDAPIRTILTGTLANQYPITVKKDNAVITLRDVTINLAVDESFKYPGIICNTNVTIILEGENYIKGHCRCPAIYIKEGCTLTIKGTGSLTAVGRNHCAGIGAGVTSPYRAAGNIVIESGSIKAEGGTDAPGIGSSTAYNTNTGPVSGARCGTITIMGGTVEAIADGDSSMSPAAIGCGTATCGNITIGPDVTKVVATWKSSNLAEPIGSAYNGGTCSAVSIALADIEDEVVSSGKTKRTYRQEWNGDLGTLDRDATARDGMVIYGTSVDYHKVYIAAGATVTLSDANSYGPLTCQGDATVILEGENVASISGAKDYTLTIKGDGSLLAGSENWPWTGGPGIGGGNIVIESGTIEARSFAQAVHAAAIGAGATAEDSCGTITIGPGVTKIVATINKTTNYDMNAQPIGVGDYSSCGKITVDPSLSDVTSESSGYITRTITRARGAEAAAAYNAWATENGVSGAWDDTDANGVANAFRYVFDRADAAFAGVVIIGFEADGEGAVAIQTLPIVNGKEFFTFTIVASDNADGTGNVMEYPLSVDDPEGITIIEEEYNPHRFFRIRIDVK